MNILAIDLGTHTGFASEFEGCIRIFSETLCSEKEMREARKLRLDRRCDPRINAFRVCLQGCGIRDHETVVFEDVQFASSTYQVQLWASLRAVLWLSIAPGTLIEAVPVGTLKKFATGNGSATKQDMARALKTQYPEVWRPDLASDDDAVDAFWLFAWAKHNLARIKK